MDFSKNWRPHNPLPDLLIWSSCSSFSPPSRFSRILLVTIWVKSIPTYKIDFGTRDADCALSERGRHLDVFDLTVIVPHYWFSENVGLKWFHLSSTFISSQTKYISIPFWDASQNKYTVLGVDLDQNILTSYSLLKMTQFHSIFWFINTLPLFRGIADVITPQLLFETV